MISLAIILLTVSITVASDSSCHGNSGHGGKCDSNSDCVTAGSVCHPGKQQCQCHSSFYFNPSTNTCEKAPSQIGEDCRKPKSFCKPPLTCEGNDKCVCPFGSNNKGLCRRATLDIACTDNSDCTDPFTSCDKSTKKCSCLAGTKLVKGKCLSTLMCPDNSKPTKDKCRVHVDLNSEVFENTPNTGGLFDDCATGSFCVTDGVSPLGFCCSATCPFGPANNGRSCESGTCVGVGLYCHRIIGPSFSYALCCANPCNEQNPVYVKGECYPKAALNTKCSVSEQCDGGHTMECSKSGICVCRPGHTVLQSTLQKGLTCATDCGKLEAIGNRCLPTKVAHGQACKFKLQCERGNSTCIHGVCTCACGYQASGNNCTVIPYAGPTASPGGTPAPTFGGFIGQLIKIGR